MHSNESKNFFLQFFFRPKKNFFFQMFTQNSLANFTAQMMASQNNFLPPTKLFSTSSILSESTTKIDWNQIFSDFTKNSCPIIPQPNFQDFLLAKLNDLNQQFILQQILKNFNEIQQQKVGFFLTKKKLIFFFRFLFLHQFFKKIKILQKLLQFQENVQIQTYQQKKKKQKILNQKDQNN